MREPYARQARALSVPGGGERGEIAVGERQHGDVARRLAEIDRFATEGAIDLWKVSSKLEELPVR